MASLRENMPLAPETTPPTTEPSPAPTPDRDARWAALKQRRDASKATNFKAAAAESQRLATDPAFLAALARKRDVAAHHLLKAETAAEGEDFERKRAWDYTVDESERWDRRMAKRARNRDGVAFQDYSREAGKVYKRQVREMAAPGNKEAYEKAKVEAVQRAARSGNLEVVETPDGELLAVDQNGAFYSTADTTEFVRNKPEKAAVDRLVADLQKAEDMRLKKRRERKGEDDDPDVTYINEKNKQFNQKLARFYNKVGGCLGSRGFGRGLTSRSIPQMSGTTSSAARPFEDDLHTLKAFMMSRCHEALLDTARMRTGTLKSTLQHHRPLHSITSGTYFTALSSAMPLSPTPQSSPSRPPP